MTPCIVLGLESQIGLSIVRELGGAGVPVIGIARSATEIGLASRYLTESLIVPEPRSHALLEAIRAIGQRHPGAVLMAVSEANVRWLATRRAELGAVVPAVPDLDSLDKVLDKQQTLALARTLGIPVPATHEPVSLPEALSLTEQLRFPVVLKWKSPEEINPVLERASVKLLKAEYCNTPAEYSTAMHRYAPVQQWPLVQEYAAGIGLGQFFFMHEGKAVRRFQHLRVAEWPPEGGFSSVCDAVPLDQHAPLQELSVRLLQALRWEGVAMVEYRFDLASGQARLMEVNGRFWGSFPLAEQAGAGFALLAYSLQGCGKMPELPPLLNHLRCRMTLTEMKRLIRIVLQPKLIRDPNFSIRPWWEVRRFMGDFFRADTCYFVWRRDDPGPWWADLKSTLGKVMRLH